MNSHITKQLCNGSHPRTYCILRCFVCIVVSCIVCIVVVVLCVLSYYVYLLYYVCIAVFFTLDAGLLAQLPPGDNPTAV